MGAATRVGGTLGWEARGLARSCESREQFRFQKSANFIEIYAKIPLDNFCNTDISVYQCASSRRPKRPRCSGFTQPNLQRAIREKRITAPPLVNVGRMKVRLWSKADVEKARKELKQK